MWHKINVFEDDNGLKIIEKVPVKESDPIKIDSLKTIDLAEIAKNRQESEPSYSGVVPVMTNVGPHPFGFEFPQGVTFQEAQANFEKYAKEAIEEFQNKSKIVTPSGANPNLFMPKK